MRLRVGPVPDDPRFHPEEGDWHKLGTPSFGLLMLLSLPTSLLTAGAVLFVWAAVAAGHGLDVNLQLAVTARTRVVSVAAVAALAVLHELLHAAALPRFGLAPGAIVGFWPRKLAAYVAYQGELPRYRFILVGLMPLLLLTAFPIIVGMVSAWMPAWVVMLSAVNAFISSGDVINTALLLWQTPPSAIVRNKELETWWRLPAR